MLPSAPVTAASPHAAAGIPAMRRHWPVPAAADWGEAPVARAISASDVSAAQEISFE